VLNNTLPDLVVLSHLRWVWVWQRPQHLISRLAEERKGSGSRTWFVEEPVVESVDTPTVRFQEADGITRVWLALPDGPAVPGFDAPGAEGYGELLVEFFREHGRAENPDVFLYTPLAIDTARWLSPRVLAYDVMDDLASFQDAPLGLKLAQRRTLAAADVVFAGGRTLHRSIAAQSPGPVHLFPSGVDTAHYASSRDLRALRHDGRRVAGYVGVIDERLDLELLAELAAALPDWTIRVVGPVAKIDPAALPQAPNIEYPGMASYPELPGIMAQFDVALMPFALNEATRSISPTKTLEYLAAGLPVVSTRVPDVVADFSDVVHLADSAEQFAEACLTVVEHSREERDKRVKPIQTRYDWDVIASAMSDLITQSAQTSEHVTQEAPAISGASLSRWTEELEVAHIHATAAAVAGLQDPALASIRLAGPAVPELAEAAVSSATPFLRAPLLARVSAALLLHPHSGDEFGQCLTCRVPAPCPTARALKS
jgi:glycosyltransferase involved in cell wall biosynthesis